jgi:periplasmic divalent cation tolerance protein
MAANFIELVLTCGSWQEAQRIVDSLLEKRLIACAEFMEVQSKYHWKGKLQDDKEIRLVMESAAHLFDSIEEEVRKLRSYEAFVLQTTPILQLSRAAGEWLDSTLQTIN